MSIFACFSSAFAQSTSLVPPETTEKALRIAQKIEQQNLILKASISLEDLKLDTLPDAERLKVLRLLAMDTAFFRTNLSKSKIYTLYQKEAKQQNSARDMKITAIFDLQ
ncbi:MAG: hypothetical protein L3J65_02025, partial [Robiginitomaculum sp.]|nr:hypothetical protein [Robiginitomaculum sp.]